MKNPLIILSSVATAMIVTLGLWFAPTHGQANADLAQLVDVTVLDDAGNAVPSAGISLQRMRGADATNVPRGGATNGAGERSIEMPVAEGRYRIVLDVPQGYSEHRDDADDTNPGPNAECAGIAKRCVLLDVDAAGTVTLTAPRRGANATAITFFVQRDQKPTLLTVTQADVGGNPVHGGTFVMQPYTVVRVGGQDVRQWGRASRTGMTTASRTFRVEPHTSYSIRWEPPEGWLKVSPGAPSFGYEITTGEHGTTTKSFVVRRPAAPGGSSTQLDGGTPSTGNMTGTPSIPDTPEMPEETPPAETVPPADPQQPSPPSSDPQGSLIPESSDNENVPAADVSSSPTETVADVPDPVVDEAPGVVSSEPIEEEIVVEVEVIDVSDVLSNDSELDAEYDLELEAELDAEAAAGMGIDLEAQAATELDAQLAAEADAAQELLAELEASGTLDDDQAAEELLAELEAAGAADDDRSEDDDQAMDTMVSDPELAAEWALETGLDVENEAASSEI